MGLFLSAILKLFVMGVLYLLFRITGWVVSILPFWMLYGLSDLLYLFIFYVLRYRIKVTKENMTNAFPNKSPQEKKIIMQRFYRNLCDIIVEVLKTKNISVQSLSKRIKFHNYEIIEKLHAQHKSTFVSIGHCGNWEWMAIKLAMISKHKPFAVVKPLNDKFFDEYMAMLRTKSGYSNLIKFKQTYRTLYKMKDDLFLAIIASDQTPTKDEINYWTMFLNQETPFYLGLEKISKSLNLAVLFFDIVRVKRGRYEIFINLITDNPQDTEQYEITEKYVRLLEASIKKHPDNWLWSHRRWKHKAENNKTRT